MGRRPMPELTCPICGARFTPKAMSGGKTTARYCSGRCRLTAWARRTAAKR